MEKQKHTPGPWKIGTGNDMEKDRFARAINGPGWRLLAHVHYTDLRDDTEGEANADLIAASPELLEACKEFVFLEKTNMTKKQVRLRIDIARIAIAKAEPTTLKQGVGDEEL